jgi:hypothetical protein
MKPLWENIGKKKTHSSSIDAFNCTRRYMVRQQGYTPVGSRAFSPPDGGPILILTKKIRFGGMMRRGKSEGVGRGAARFMPRQRMSGMVF